MRHKPDIRALWAGAQRPRIRIVLGAVLMAPAALLMAGNQLDTLEATGQLGPTAAQSQSAALVEQADALARYRGEGQSDADVAPPASAREEAPDWLALFEREEEASSAEEAGEARPVAVVASLASEFKIPVKLAAQIHSAAVAENIRPRTAFGLVRAESSFRTKVVSPVGAVGLTQLLPSTARWLVPGTTQRDLMEPQTNLRVGFRYLRHLMDQYNGNEKLALTAYNRGPGTVSKVLKRGGNPDNGYAEKVLTGKSTRHVALMNAKFPPKRTTRKTGRG